MSAVYAYEAEFPDIEDSETRLWAEQDYRWAVRVRLFEPSEQAWKDFGLGYKAGGEVGRRRFGRSVSTMRVTTH
jgi:hypothetical protein